MRHSSHPNPDWIAPSNATNLKAFLREAREYHQAKAPLTGGFLRDEWSWPPLPYRREPKPCRYSPEILHWLYKLGRDLRVLPISFYEFSHAVTDWPQMSRRAYKKRLRKRMREAAQRPGRWQDPLPYRVRNQHAHVARKELSAKEIARRDWREKKEFGRDQKQRGYHRQCSAKTWAKKVSNRSERRHVRQCLHADKPILPHRWFNDPWMWD